jgi:uncharacterized protein Yka (UPF0111/DUF47 family)
MVGSKGERMRDTIDMARENMISMFKAFEALVRADEREQGQKWFDVVTAQHKQLILDEREACAKVCDAMYAEYPEENQDYAFALAARQLAAAIRARGNT